MAVAAGVIVRNIELRKLSMYLDYSVFCSEDAEESKSPPEHLVALCARTIADMEGVLLAGECEGMPMSRVVDRPQGKGRRVEEVCR